MMNGSIRAFARARWAAMMIAGISVLIVGLMQRTNEASAQGTIGGANFTLVSLATTANPASRDVGFLWNPGTAQASYQLIRVTSNASGNATIAIPNPVGLLGSQNIFVDTVPTSAGSAACYRLVPLSSGGA